MSGKKRVATDPLEGGAGPGKLFEREDPGNWNRSFA